MNKKMPMDISLEEVKFSDIRMNSESPRLPKSVNGFTMDELIVYFLFNEALNSIVGSMSMLGWFPTEPIMLQKMYDGTYTVIDGNRRVAACWLMLNVDSKLCPEHIKKIVKEMKKEDVERLKIVPAFINK